MCASVGQITAFSCMQCSIVGALMRAESANMQICIVANELRSFFNPELPSERILSALSFRTVVLKIKKKLTRDR